MSTEIRCTSGLHVLETVSSCVQCRKIRNLIWNSADPRATQHAFNVKCAEAIADAQKFVKHREYLQRQADLAQALLAEQVSSVRGKVRREERVSALRAYSNNMRAKRIRSEGLLSNDLLDRLYKLQKGKCPCCKRALGKDFHMDHIEPLSKGGANVDSNIQLLRSRCNLLKSAMDPLIFMQINGFLI